MAVWKRGVTGANLPRLSRAIARLALLGALEGLALLATDWAVPGIWLVYANPVGAVAVAASTALVLAILNALIRPILVLLMLPLNVLTLGAPILAINGAILRLAGSLSSSLVVESWRGAVWGSLVLAAANAGLTQLVPVGDSYPLFGSVVRWLSRGRRSSATEAGRGLAILEIDGLSYARIQRAIERGLMPTVREMLDSGTYTLSRYDCGLPSQTSACQAGIMYGDNFDIPAFRWYDKEKKKLVVSNHADDAAEIEARYPRERGLLRGGSSINNLVAGGADKALFTVSTLTDKPVEMERRSLEDLYLLWLDPHFFVRSVMLTAWDMVVELFQGIRQRARNVRPRVNRLHKAFPLRRAVANVLLRDLGTLAAVMDVVRGLPAIYVSFVGYDEIAHYAGPDTRDAMDSLRGLDRQIRRIWDAVRHNAWRPYDLILLSDHGQSAGATFKQRYGQTLTQLVIALVDQGAAVTEIKDTLDSHGHAMALLAEIEGLERRMDRGRIRKATLRRARTTLQRRLGRHPPPYVSPRDVVVCVSGNLAHVYLGSHADKVPMGQLDEMYPGLLEGLIAHPGVGFVVAYARDGTPWALGERGARNLETGAVRGTDPLQPYGNVERHAAQLLRLARFPHAGDLIVNSALYEGGEVAAFEELVGSHGGLGGQQTEAFLLHPTDMVVPAISNAAEVFALLNARRGSLLERPRPRAAASPSPWPLAALAEGVRTVRGWVLRLTQSLGLL